ncbi:MAG: hypothetical protein Fur0016_26260 [Anaerolineales bacterium]
MTLLAPLSRLPAALLPALADLHCATLPTLLTDLGRPFVLRYYQLAQTDPSVIAFVASPDDCSLLTDNSSLMTDNCLLAYCLGSPNPSHLTARLRTPASWFVGQMLKLAFTRPGVLVQLAQSLFSASDANTLQPGQIELTYIGVAPQARGRGLGKTILSAFAESARNAGYTSVALSVETDNSAALALYTKFGFTITQTFAEGRYHRHRMERNLST